MAEPASFPARGQPTEELLEAIRELRADDADWRGGRAFSLVYNADDAELETLHDAVGSMFLAENALNPFAFPSLRRMEAEVVAMASALVHLEGGDGSMSSGGTESIFLAVHTAREAARARGVENPSVLTAATAHPAFAKACHYLGLDHLRTPHGPDGRADPAAMIDALDERCALVVASAPCYPFGVIDPVADLAAAAADRGVPCHVDACLGGWLLPFWEEIGERVPPWDFRVPGVTSLSADIHKYGYAFKGASVVLYRDPAMMRRQWFLYDDWPGGLYGSPTAAGTRPAAPIAGAWATIRHLGRTGYQAKARVVRDTTLRFRNGIGAIDGLEVRHRPDLSLFEFGAAADGDGRPVLDIAGVADVMDDRGWGLDRQEGGLHLMVSPYHAHVVDRFLADLADAVAHHDASRGRASTYGGAPPAP
ncbi:pyridoxal phosphate-dependent decarboxylase family protein [Rhabdothermincola salaria]|uniref:pyridoxal phosphate-dependent decarboxylase family protein n=1 Tax=Rhabdothermincola salaria TaxID=2903142 RepID=UPI001E5578D8|nr:aminotransferase class V-fold PLP-dependent enzyme [Rhabdothermincola salaria]